MALDSFTNQELDEIAQKLKIKNYVNTRMKDELKNQTINDKECGIVGSMNSDESYSFNHWTLNYKNNQIKTYYSSFGDYPSQEIINYLGRPILTSDIQLQSFTGTDKYFCGGYCLIILYLLSNNIPFEDIIIFLMP